MQEGQSDQGDLVHWVTDVYDLSYGCEDWTHVF